MFYQDNCRFWGEEKEKDAIWGIYLKKVRYQRPSAIVQIVQAGGPHSLTGGLGGVENKQNGTSGDIPEEENQEEIAHLMWETVRIKILKAGTLEKVVEAVANDDTDVQVCVKLKSKKQLTGHDMWLAVVNGGVLLV